MILQEPIKNILTVYTRDNCINCEKLKGYLLNTRKVKFKFIYCDEFLNDEETKKHFLNQITYFSGRKVRTFPMVFVDGRYIGGYYETLEYFEDF